MKRAFSWSSLTAQKIRWINHKTGMQNRTGKAPDRAVRRFARSFGSANAPEKAYSFFSSEEIHKPRRRLMLLSRAFRLLPQGLA